MGRRGSMCVVRCDVVGSVGSGAWGVTSVVTRGVIVLGACWGRAGDVLGACLDPAGIRLTQIGYARPDKGRKGVSRAGEPLGQTRRV